MSVRIDRDVINALIAGHFADPFSVLGMHQTDAGLEVRALLPDATEVWVIEPKTGRKVGKLDCLDSRGFFCAVLPRRKNFFRYQLAVVWHGQQNLIDDPYRFGPLIQDMDAWLLSEGTHLRPYETLGAHAAVRASGGRRDVVGRCADRGEAVAIKRNFSVLLCALLCAFICALFCALFSTCSFTQAARAQCFVDGPAQVFCHPDYAGEIGLIMPYEKDFCATCNRLRVSSVGKLHLCLFGEGGVDLRDLMAEDQQQAALEARIAEALTHKKQTHFLHQGNTGITQNLSYIGG